MAAIHAYQEVAPLLSDGYFSVDGTIVRVWASMKRFQPEAPDTLLYDDPNGSRGADAAPKIPEPTNPEPDPMTRSSRNEGYAFSITNPKRIEKVFGWTDGRRHGSYSLSLP